jgi:hypothetical protein
VRNDGVAEYDVNDEQDDQAIDNAEKALGAHQTRSERSASPCDRTIDAHESRAKHLSEENWRHHQQKELHDGIECVPRPGADACRKAEPKWRQEDAK